MEMPKLKFVPVFAKQTVEFYKNIFDNTFNTLMTLQEQMLKILEKAPGLPEGGIVKLDELSKTYKKMCVDFRNTVDEKVFKHVEALLASEEAPVKKAEAKPKTKDA